MPWIIFSLDNVCQINVILVITIQVQSFLDTGIFFARFEPTAVLVQAMVDLKMNSGKSSRCNHMKTSTRFMGCHQSTCECEASQLFISFRNKLKSLIPTELLLPDSLERCFPGLRRVSYMYHFSDSVEELFHMLQGGK